MYDERRSESAEARSLGWIIKEDLKTFPREIQREVGQVIYAAQRGEEYPSVKALKGFGGRSVLEIVASAPAGTYRTVYTVRLQEAIYVLHAFRKKAKKGIATPQTEIELIRKRLLDAEQDYRQRQH